MTGVSHTSSNAVAACTAAAAHRRDHLHAPHEMCHPHVVEVVHLGALAMAVCHDCGIDSGFVPAREAESLSSLHRESTVPAPPAGPVIAPPAAA